MKTQTIVISEGQRCKIDAEVQGSTIEGPAVIMILEAVSVKPEYSTESCFNIEAIRKERRTLARA